MTILSLDLPRRDWVYAMTPPELMIAPCHKCGCKEIKWSEFKRKVWCPVCCVDFTPEHWGIIDGPVGIEMAKMLGFTFDSVDLRVMQRVPFESETWPYSSLFNAALTDPAAKSKETL